MTNSDIPDVHEFMKSQLRKGIDHMLSTCTDKQQEFFHRVWPEKDLTTEKNLMSAYELVRRTVIKNSKGRA